MPNNKIRFNVTWKTKYNWLEDCEDPYTAKCTLCKSTFKISSSGIGQVKIHACGIKHQNILAVRGKETNQPIFVNEKNDKQLVLIKAVPSRDHVLYLTFPKEWKLSDIIQLFSPFGNVYVAWVDDRSAYIGVQKRDQTAVALSTLSQSDTYTVISYAKRQAQLAGHNFLSTSPHQIRKKRCLDNSNIMPKKRRTASFGESSTSKRKRSIDPIVEDPEELQQMRIDDEDTGMPVLRVESMLTNTARKVKKTFQEANEWD